MADYQEYRRRILHRRWRRVFITAALLILLVLLAAVGILWKRLHREPSPNTAQQGPTILQQELTGSGAMAREMERWPGGNASTDLSLLTEFTKQRMAYMDSMIDGL